MQKIKVQIKGMNCKSCAMLIEDRLKNKAGITAAKVNFDSGRGVVVYDSSKIKEQEIFDAINSAGDYEVTKEENKIKEKIQEEEDNRGTDRCRESLSSESNDKKIFWLGLLVGISIVSLITNVILLAILFKSPTIEGQNIKAASAQAVNQPLVQQPAPSADNQPAAVQKFDITKNDNVRGNFNAPITLVEFSDFECPFCGKIYPTFKKIIQDYPDKVRLVYKHFPLSFHPNGEKAAESAECAAEQGKFWEYHDKLFDNQQAGFSLEKFKQWAKDLGLKESKFSDCLDSGKYASKVNTEFQEGSSKGVNGTPATFVNGQLVSGAQPYESFKQVIDSLLTK
jgi:protein-disulfide isomerase/copper chaperone CopZ